MNFIQEHGRKGLVDLQAFKKGLDHLNPYAVHDRLGRPRRLEARFSGWKWHEMADFRLI